MSSVNIIGGEISSWATFHDGRKAPIYFCVKTTISDGDLKMFTDCHESSDSIMIYLASGEEGIEASEREYIEICIKRDGSYTFVPYSGQNQQADDELELERDIIINSNDDRWQAVVFIPFFFLPTPGETQEDELCMRWMLNIVVSTPNDDEVLSIAKLPPGEGRKPFDLHSIDHFSELIMSDADSGQLRSISRASRVSSNKTAELRGLDVFMDEVGRSSHVARTRKMSSLISERSGSPEVKTIFMDTEDAPVSSRTLYETLEKVHRVRPLSPDSQILLDECSHTLGLVMRDDERVLYINKFWCRWGWSTRKVMLVLTFSAVESKLYLVDAKRKMLMRALPWSNTRPLLVTLESTMRFNLEVVEDNNRGRKTYHFYDREQNKDVVRAWVEMIEEISILRNKYVRQALGQSAHKDLQDNLAKLRGGGVFKRYCVIS